MMATPMFNVKERDNKRHLPLLWSQHYKVIMYKILHLVLVKRSHCAVFTDWQLQWYSACVLRPFGLMHVLQTIFFSFYAKEYLISVDSVFLNGRTRVLAVFGQAIYSMFNYCF